jgi:hypothetical protein
MVNYNKSSIYKLCCNDLNIKEIYIGSTTNFTKRKQKHKSNCININSPHYHVKVYKFMRENGGWTNWSMILIDNVSCENKLELHKIERDYIEKNNSILNCHIPGRTQKEFYEKNKEYYDDNKEKILKQKNEYYQKNKENYKEYYEKNKEKIKERINEYNKKYYQKKKEYMKEYYECNKEKLNEQKKEKMICECGSTIRIDNKPRHNKTKKHINFINNNK